MKGVTPFKVANCDEESNPAFTSACPAGVNKPACVLLYLLIADERSLAEIALNANPSDYEAIRLNAEILESMAAGERSFIARNFFAGAARQLRERAKS